MFAALGSRLRDAAVMYEHDGETLHFAMDYCCYFVYVAYILQRLVYWVPCPSLGATD